MSAIPEVEALHGVETYPSTNITRLFRYAGRMLPDCLGGGCLWLSAQLARGLRERLPHMRVSYHDLGTPGSHTALVSYDGRERKMYEPTLFQVSPFSLTRLAASPKDCFSDTFPLEGGYRLKLKYTWVRPDEALLMELISPRGYTIREYRYDLTARVSVNEDDPYADLPFIERQDQIYVHVLNLDRTKSTLTLGTRTRRMNIGRMSDRLYVETEPGFNSRFEAVAARMRLTAEELKRLLHEALEIHNAQYPNP